MFTGIVDHIGTITKIENFPDTRRFWILSNFSELVLGESISVDGICLTVTNLQDGFFTCDISPETLAVTTAKTFKAGQMVNLERALQLSSRLGGHLVSGHIDQVAQVKSIRQLGEFTVMVFTGINIRNINLLVNKGSIAINGTSLTINSVSETDFEVMLIPHTLERTNLSKLKESSEVNLEFDMVARMVTEQTQRYLQQIKV